jgi:hypothetical protein
MKFDMRGVKSSARLIAFLAGIVIANACLAAGNVIEVVKAEGSVTTSDSAGKQKKAVGSKSILPRRNTLVTGQDGRAVVRVGNAGYIVLEKNSKIEIGKAKDRAGFLRQITGMIYYALNSVKGDQKLEVRTKTATIGVRGTRFLVTDLPDRNEIGMRKGLVSVTSPEGEFEIHRKAGQDEFEVYKQEAQDAIAKQKKEFDEYKADTEREFVEYKREFSLGANRMASFDGKRVVDRPLSAESIKDMEGIEAYAEEWLKEVHD